jgi:hypothetical protein
LGNFANGLGERLRMRGVFFQLDNSGIGKVPAARQGGFQN